MNILLHALPKTVKIGAQDIEIVTDYRAAIEFEILNENGEKSVYKLLKPFFPKGIKTDLSATVDAVLWFYRCGGEAVENNDAKSEFKKDKRSYSFTVDREVIYADFMRFYKIDLSETSLHWWKFKALLLGLPEDSAFKERIYYRLCDLKGLPKKERERITKIRKQIEIKVGDKPQKMTLEERNQKMIDYINRRAEETKG